MMAAWMPASVSRSSRVRELWQHTRWNACFSAVGELRPREFHRGAHLNHLGRVGFPVDAGDGGVGNLPSGAAQACVSLFVAGR
jgi:hypothetical protein